MERFLHHVLLEKLPMKVDQVDRKDLDFEIAVELKEGPAQTVFVPGLSFQNQKTNWFNPGMDAAMRFRNGFMEVGITSHHAVLSAESHIDTVGSAMIQCRWQTD